MREAKNSFIGNAFSLFDVDESVDALRLDLDGESNVAPRTLRESESHPSYRRSMRILGSLVFGACSSLFVWACSETAVTSADAGTTIDATADAADAATCPFEFPVEGAVCPSPGLRCNSLPTPCARLCGQSCSSATATCQADGTWRVVVQGGAPFDDPELCPRDAGADVGTSDADTSDGASNG